jgi:hypothetical protein
MSQNPLAWTRRGALGALGVAGGAGMASRPAIAEVGSHDIAEAGQPNIASVADFGAVGDGRRDDTAAFRRAVDHLVRMGGGTLVLPKGDFLTETISFPYDPVRIDVAGSGPRSTIWRMADPIKPIIAIDHSSPPHRVTGTQFANFAVAANPLGRADRPEHIAIDAQGFNDALFRNIRFMSNGDGSVGALFYTSATTHLTYHQRFERLTVQECIGPGRVIATGSGNGHLGNTNLIHVDGFWIYANREMEVAFDLNRCSMYSVRNGLIEESAKYGILLGNAGLVESIWFEKQELAPIQFASFGDGAASSNNLLQNLYFGGFGGKVDIPVGCVNNTFQNVTGGNFQIVTADPLAWNVTTSSTGQGGKPGLKQIHGAIATWQEVQALRVSNLDGLWQIFYLFQLPSAGNYAFRFEPPEGRRITKLWVTACDGSDGTVAPCAIGWPIYEFFVSARNSNPLSVVAQISYE